MKSVENSPAAKGRKKYWHSDGLKAAQVEFYDNDVLEYLKQEYEPEWSSEDGSRIVFDIPKIEFIDWQGESRPPWFHNLRDVLKGRMDTPKPREGS